jgi:hypothetical protein
MRLRHMCVKSMCHIRSTANLNPKMVAETACILDPQVAWVRSTMTEAKIQALVDRGCSGRSEDHVWFEDRWMVASLCDE